MREKFIVARLITASGVWLPVYIFLAGFGRSEGSNSILVEITLALTIVVYVLLAYGLRHVPSKGPLLVMVVPIWVLGLCGGWLIFGCFDLLATTIGINQMALYPAVSIIACVGLGVLGIFSAVWLVQHRNE